MRKMHEVKRAMNEINALQNQLINSYRLQNRPMVAGPSLSCFADQSVVAGGAPSLANSGQVPHPWGSQPALQQAAVHAAMLAAPRAAHVTSPMLAGGLVGSRLDSNSMNLMMNAGGVVSPDGGMLAAPSLMSATVPVAPVPFGGPQIGYGGAAAVNAVGSAMSGQSFLCNGQMSCAPTVPLVMTPQMRVQLDGAAAPLGGIGLATNAAIGNAAIAMPGAIPAAIPVAMPVVMPVMPGAIIGALPSAIPGAIPSAIPGALPGALPGAIPGAIPGAVLGGHMGAMGGSMVSPALLPDAPPPLSSYKYLELDMSYPGLKQIHERPPIYLIENFVSLDICETLIANATPLLQRSKTHAVAGSEATIGRTSLTCHLKKCTPPCAQLLTKIQALTNKPYDHMELPQVARYTDSQRYVEHYDGVDPHTPAGQAFCMSGGQRIATVLVYLNDVLGGGATFFKRLNLEVRPRRGNALIFFPGFLNGEIDPEALHAGMPPVGTKWVSQVWIRQFYRGDGQPSVPVPLEEQALIGPFHKGVYSGHCLRGHDLFEAVMTWDEAVQWAERNPQCEGFTYKHSARCPKEPTRFWFKSHLHVLVHEEWWTYSLGRGLG